MNKEIEAFQQHKTQPGTSLPQSNCERHIKLISEASAAVAGFKNKDGLIREKYNQNF